MENSDEITRWIQGLGAGNQRAADELWRVYFDKLARLARVKLNPAARRQADEEDVALSAMHSFCRGVKAGRYPQLSGRDELWRLLVTIVAHKAAHEHRRQSAQKRGGGRTRGESGFVKGSPDDSRDGIEQVLGAEPSPELAAMVAESCQRLLVSLEDESLRQVAALKLEGYTNEELADRLGCTTRSVERKLSRIRHKWTELGLS